MSTNYSTVRGDDFTISLSFKDSNGQAIDITNYIILMNLKTDKFLPDSKSSLEVDGVIDSGAEGLAHLTISSDESKNLLGTYYYDIKYIDNEIDNGIVKTFASGVIDFIENVTIRNE